MTSIRRRDPRMERLMLPLLIALATLATPASGQGWIEPPRVAPAGWGVSRIRTDVHVELRGNVAQVEVEEWFRNDGGPLGESDYVYPLPGEAVFSDFSLWQGDEELKGETMDAERARSIYEEIVRRKRDPALIEMVGHGLVRARVFPIAPGETRRITLRYTQLLERTGDALAFRYAAAGRTPGGVTPRPMPVPQPMPQRRGEDARTPRPTPDGAPLRFELVAADGARFGEPFSPTHPLRVERAGGRLTVRPAAELSGDFSLFLPLERGLVGMTVAAHRPSAGEDGYFMLTLSPGATTERGLPRDVTAVVDVSGSMSGAKLRQTQDALRQLLASLGPRDRFRLIAFSSGVRTFAADWTAADPSGLRAARRWVDALSATGGTNIAGALDEAFRVNSPDGRLPLVVFLTDGLPTVAETDPERIAAAAESERARARVFAFGVGYDVNTYLLDRLSEAGRGATEYVGPDEDVEAAVGRLASKVSHPVLTDLEIDGAPVELTEIYPQRLPDLFAGEELVVFGRYRADRRDREGAVRLHGRRADRTENFQVDAAFPTHEDANDWIPRLWASRKIGSLMQAIRLNGRDEELVDEVRRTALRYGILTEFTSHLVQEPMAFAQALPGAPPPVMRDMAQAAPSAASGAGAVAQSKSSARRQQVSSAADMVTEEAEVAARVRNAAGLSGVSRTRFVAGRLFVEKDGAWRDGRIDSDARTLKVRPFSPAYFELLRLLPELKPVVAELEHAVVGGAKINLAFVDDGGETLSGSRDALVRDFRGL